MSTGPRRDRRRGEPVAPTRPGRGKSARRGLSFLPIEAQRVAKEILAEEGLSGLPVLVCLCRLTGGEVVRCRLEGRRLLLPGPDGAPKAFWPLPERLVPHVKETLTTLAEAPGRRVSDDLSRLQRAVASRLSDQGYRWSRHLAFGMNVFHFLADAAAAELWWEHPNKLRAWRRSAWAVPEEVLPASTDVVAADYDEAEAPFWDAITARLTAADRAALAALDWPEQR